ncbi:hypothetical protein [Methylocella sp.]|uniref:hypothetical protein n=1 Tax=Methylocella sp. TaxID=1978226 RepID=UPI0037841B0C
MRWLAALLAFAGLVAPLAAQDASVGAPPPAVVVRQSVDPASGAVVGQRVAIYVDVLFRGRMPRPPRLSLPDTPGAQIFRFETQGLTLRETIDGEAYVGQRFEFAFYARRGGAFEARPAVVTLLDADGGVTGHAEGQATRFDVAAPLGVDVSQPVVAAQSLALDEQWRPAPTGPFKPGDALTRVISRSAEDVPGLAMRDLAFPAPDGVRAYVDPPDIDDRSERGVVTGRRTDRVTYVFERGGAFALPAVVQPWWDLGSRSLKSAEAPGATIRVEEPPPAPDAPRPSGRLDAARLALLAAGGLGLAALALAAARLARRRRSDPERAAFAALRRACSGADAATIYRRFSDWARTLPQERRRAARNAMTGLEAALFRTPAKDWSRDDSRRLLADAQALRRPPQAGAVSPLPPLNPGGTGAPFS